jgi:hypothetical protein
MRKTIFPVWAATYVFHAAESKSACEVRRGQHEFQLEGGLLSQRSVRASGKTYHRKLSAAGLEFNLRRAIHEESFPHTFWNTPHPQCSRLVQ